MRPQRSKGFGEKYPQAQWQEVRPRSTRPLKFGHDQHHFRREAEERESVVDSCGEVQTTEEVTVYVSRPMSSSWQYKSSKTRLQSYRWENSAKEHGYSYEWPVVKKPQLTKNGKIILCSTENVVPIAVPGLPTGFPSSSASSSSTSVPQDKSHDTSSSPAFSEVTTDRAIQQKPKRGQRTGIEKSIARFATVVGGVHRKSQRQKKCQHQGTRPQTLRNVQRKWDQGSAVFIPTSRHTEIAKSAREPTSQGLLAGSALAMQYVGRKLRWHDHSRSQVLTERCESRNNHRYAVVVQDLATQWIQAYPCKTKTSQETQRSLQKVLGAE